jgi:uncharacterized protein YggL (DUF469 family)
MGDYKPHTSRHASKSRDRYGCWLVYTDKTHLRGFQTLCFSLTCVVHEGVFEANRHEQYARMYPE